MQFADAARRLMRLRRGANVAALAHVFGLKAVITALSFALVTLAARALQPDVFGTYSLLFSAAGLLGIAATLGQQVLVMRFWSEYVAARRDDLLKGALIFSATACLLGCVIFGVPFYLWCAGRYGDGLEVAIVLYLVAFSLVMTTAHLVRSAIGVGIGDGVANILLALPGIAYLGACIASGVQAELSVSFGAMAAGGVLAIVVHLVALRRSLAIRLTFLQTGPAFCIPQWTTRSAKLWMSNVLEATNQYLDVLVIGFLMDPVTAGAWFVLTRLANIISVATDAIHMFATRQIPDLYFRGETLQLSGMLNTVACVVLMVIIGSIVGIVVAGGWLLAIFSNSYVAYHGILVILAVGAAAGAAAGAAPSLLMLTGHEGRYLAILGGAVLLRLGAFVVLIPTFGVAGAAVAVALSQFATTLLIRHAVKDCTGIDASVLRIAPMLARGSLFARHG